MSRLDDYLSRLNAMSPEEWEELINREFAAPIPRYRYPARGVMSLNISREMPEPSEDASMNSSPHPINNTDCQYYSHNPYLRCAVNPEGQCEGCKDFQNKNPS